jgi:hypothetical protein
LQKKTQATRALARIKNPVDNPAAEMPIPAQFLRRALLFSVIVLAAGILISCATKKEKIPPPASAATAAAKKNGVPTPPPGPTPAPTPQARYTASAKVDGVEVTQNKVPGPESQPAPSPAPSASPTPTASPTPKPKPPSTNFLTGTWRKIFPSKPKPAPAPTPGETGHVSIRVSTSEGGEVEQVVRNGSNTGSTANAIPSPTPIQIKIRPTEPFHMRMWHRVFPKKQEPPVAMPPQWIGTIKLINERDGYALIDSPSSFSVPVGETLNSVGADAESGVLRVSADRNPPFFIADIVSGKPRAGDRVYSPKP